MKTSFPPRLRMYALLLAAALLCGGCVMPYHFVSDPGMKGRVVDARTHAPVAGAKVAWSHHYGVAMLTDPDRAALVPVTVTGADGAFLVPARKEWGIYILPMDPIGWRVDVKVDAAGYTAATRHFSLNAMGIAVPDLGEILLKKK